VVTPTLRDVALRAQVHPSTASRALNPETRPLVKPETAERVLQAASALGYLPNSIARGLKTNRSSSIGVLIPDLTNPLFPPIVRGIEDALLEAGYRALLVNTDNDPVREADQVASLRARQVDGLIVATARLEHPLVAGLAEEGFPIVLVNRRLESADIPAVTADDASGVAMAMRHIAGLGHRRVAHLAGPQWTSTGQTRLRAYRQAVLDLGLDADPALVVGADAWTEDQGSRAMEELVGRGTPFTAVLAGNDLIALGCYDVMYERGMRCPADVSVVGFNDMPFLDKLRPPLTTVRIPHYRIGTEAAHLLLQRIRDRQAPVKSILLPLSLVTRQSTAPPPSR
jgi:LacI family transcriptional regulator